MRGTRKYAWVALTSARSNLAYLGEVASRGIFLSVVLYIFLRLWTVTFSETGAETLGGLTLTQMLWYLVITEAITLSRTAVAEQVDQDVRTGALAVQLLRPILYPLYQLGNNLGERVVRFLLNALVGALVVLYFVGPLSLGPLNLAFFLLVLPFAFVLDFLGLFLIGLGAFWLEDTSGLRLIYSRLTMILGGMLLPLEIFPDAVQPLLRALPFASILYAPARLFVAPDSAFLRVTLLSQGLFIALYTLLVALIYRVAVRRIHANGG